MLAHIFLRSQGIHLKIAKKREDVCQPGVVHRGIVRPTQKVCFELWWFNSTSEDEEEEQGMEFACYGWCTKDGKLPPRYKFPNFIMNKSCNF